MAGTRRATCGRWRNPLPAALHQPQNSSRNSTVNGTIRSSRSSTNTPTDFLAAKLLRRLRGFRQVIERRNDVLGKRVGERRAFVSIANKADTATRQIRKTIGCRKHAHARTQPGFRQHRYGKSGEHGGGDCAGVRTGVEHPEGTTDRFQAIDGNPSPRTAWPAERERHALLEMSRMAV